MSNYSPTLDPLSPTLLGEESNTQYESTEQSCSVGGAVYAAASGTAPPASEDPSLRESYAACLNACRPHYNAVPPAQYAGWSPLPGTVAPIPDPQLQSSANICGYSCFPPGYGCGPCAPSKCVVPAQQPVVPVPVYQEIQHKDRIVEIPQTIVHDKVIPNLFHQEVHYEVPKLSLQLKEKTIKLPRVEFVEEIVNVPVTVGYIPKRVDKWEVREVPKVIPKYVGKPRDILVTIPQVQVVDKNVEKEVPLYVGKRPVPKEIIEEEYIDEVRTEMVRKEEEVPIYIYKPVFDVQIDIPPPLIVPIPVQPKEIRLQPEILSLDEWKRERLSCANKCKAQCGGSP